MISATEIASDSERTDASAGVARGKVALYAAFGALAVGMLVFSQTRSFFWDEGFHILAARLIATGKRPYIDFFFPQTPLNGYWNAAWIRLFGPSWRVVHAVATASTVASVVLLADYLAGLFSDRRWKIAAAFVGLALFGLHFEVWTVGTLAQAYPLCLLLIVAAFRLAIAGARRPGSGASALAGVCAGAAASSTLLAAQVAPVLLVWTWFYNRAGSRVSKAVWFVAGAATACVPFAMLLVRDQHVTLFNVLKYHTLYRRAAWPEATHHDIGVATDWVNSSQTLILVLLAIAGFFFIKRDEKDPQRRAEFGLCFWLAGLITVQNLFAHPTFPMYFAFTIPFLTVPATIGFYGVVGRLEHSLRPWPAVAVLVGVGALCVGNAVYEDTEYTTWPQLEQVAAKVKQVTPPGAAIAALEPIYFLVGGTVPFGMEHHDAHKLQLPQDEDARLHVVSKAEVERLTKAGAFYTTVVCEDDDQLAALKQWSVYGQTADVNECTVFWQPSKAAQPSQ